MLIVFVNLPLILILRALIVLSFAIGSHPSSKPFAEPSTGHIVACCFNLEASNWLQEIVDFTTYSTSEIYYKLFVYNNLAILRGIHLPWNG